ncbi:hypothetical protein INQ51_17005 [Maribellus sp. CM-23]|uniref:hypothetical protein n=1 Tax=Maribellus sp. CM-23 TaxID=2781026 RepID=UPI001F4711E8|nr:hypothetical protein [Maribellus sp. CM-23]MCE4566021.1 hypothetical protein [Maribellus sp. CM-23]
MNAFEFVSNFESYIDEIEEVIKPELIPILNKLREIDPHDVVRPDTWIPFQSNARGIVWSLFIREKRKAEKPISTNLLQ